ncbi:ADP-ribosylglycohydrolase family protein [Agreia sp. PsM10]|uniref:ADP-ribosylglycohydrolase family protein n=1 Tax=Agreia sp. PsM10 TaxID=3030533 RepID=UPI00263AC11C|nr:ADP-ribosylglycohydrolase family protein [Agreia sp. PsM10]MDN4640036.1 ADP-ribosylglycohydrolase family protein [Agreia sp. PsM10]
MTKNRARGSLIGLAIGDAMGAPTEGMTPVEIRERWGRVRSFVEEDAAGTDDTEYAVLTAQSVLAAGADMTSDTVADIWLKALEIQTAGFRGAGFSEMIALSNLQAGIRPPASGQRNSEMWSDGAAMRAAPMGIYAAGDPALARRMAVADARVSHDRDGIFCAEAMAAGVAVAMVENTIEPVLEAMLDALPRDSWSLRLAMRALDIAEAADSIESAEEELFRSIPLRHYMWADVAPEALALCVGLLRATNGSTSVIESGVNIGRDSDTIAAMGGAISGALVGVTEFDPAHVKQVRSVAGRCIEATAGIDLFDLADSLVDRSNADRGVSA